MVCRSHGSLPLTWQFEYICNRLAAELHLELLYIRDPVRLNIQAAQCAIPFKNPPITRTGDAWG
jgi:hypothetical protein